VARSIAQDRRPAECPRRAGKDDAPRRLAFGHLAAGPGDQRALVGGDRETPLDDAPARTPLPERLRRRHAPRVFAIDEEVTVKESLLAASRTTQAPPVAAQDLEAP
jgi:hypothetical protein